MRIKIKTEEELETMKEGGQKLNQVKKKLLSMVKVGVSAKDIDDVAEKMIIYLGGKPSFQMVEDYKWTTCISVNEGVVHGIPHKSIVFKEGDLVSIDVGMFYKGFHTDTSMSTAINPSKEVKRFLEGGKEAFKSAVKAIKPNNSYIYDISSNMEDTLLKYGYNPILDLTGHGVGRDLHEGPQILCFRYGSRQNTAKIVPGMALAVEVMYTLGEPDLVKEKDGWTLSTADGKIAGLFEDTIIVKKDGYEIIT